MGLRFVSPSFALIAAICFVLPWVNLQCSGTRIASQSGLQIATGELSSSDERVEEWLAGEPDTQRYRIGETRVEVSQPQTKSPQPSPLMWVYAAALGLGLLVGLLAIGLPRLGIATGLAGMVATAVLAYFLATGFPAENRFAKTAEPAAAEDTVPPGGGPGEDREAQDSLYSLGQAMARATVRVEREPAPWISLGACVLMMMFGFATAGSGRRQRDDTT